MSQSISLIISILILLIPYNPLGIDIGLNSKNPVNYDLEKSDATFIGENDYDLSGWSVSGVGDVNGDGYDDILIGAPWNNDGKKHSGKVYLILGNDSGWDTDTSLANSHASYVGDQEYNYNGWKIAGAGDVNDDGYDDILVGGKNSNISLIFGKRTGWTNNNSRGNSNVFFNGNGTSITGLGDVNGDGIDDIMIGDSNSHRNGTLSGTSYLFFGKSSKWKKMINLSDADVFFHGENRFDRSGSIVKKAGDLNGDGYNDILIGAYQYGNKNQSGFDCSIGKTYLIFGKPTGFKIENNLSDVDASYIGGYPGNKLGYSLTGAGDINGDGYDDILIGTHRDFRCHLGLNKKEGTYIVFGKSSGWTKDTPISKEKTTLIGRTLSITGVGDVNGDGYDDILIGMSEKVFLFFGKKSNWKSDIPLSKADILFTDDPGDMYGFIVTKAGDVNGDGRDDILIGAPDSGGKNPGQVNDGPGRTYLIFGIFTSQIELGNYHILFIISISIIILVAITYAILRRRKIKRIKIRKRNPKAPTPSSPRDKR